MTLAWPWLLALLPLPYVYRRLAKPLRAQAPALRAGLYTHLALAQGSAASVPPALLSRLLLWGLWVSLVLAATRPQWIGEPVSLATSGRDLLLAVDISESMTIEDMAVDDRFHSRLVAVKAVVADFLARRTGDKVGLILFGSQAYLQAPLTYDRATLNTLLQEAQIGFAGKATAIGDAIGIAIKRLEKRPAENRVLILLSDGADTASELPPLRAAQLAADYGIRIHTIGIGADALVRRDFFGTRTLHPSMDLDETTLRAIADMTGGQYFRATDPAELELVYGQLDELEPVPQEDEVLRPVREFFHWPLAVSLLLAALVALRRQGGTDNG